MATLDAAVEVAIKALEGYAPNPTVAAILVVKALWDEGFDVTDVDRQSPAGVGERDGG